MRAGLETRAERHLVWKSPRTLVASILVPIYKAGNRLDRWWKLRRRPDDLESVFIIVVGNITVGGSGKTPLVIKLCQLCGRQVTDPASSAGVMAERTAGCVWSAPLPTQPR